MRWGGEQQGQPTANGDFNMTFAGIIAMLLALIVINFWITMDNRHGRQEQRAESEKLKKDIETAKADLAREVQQSVREGNERIATELKSGRSQLEHLRGVIQTLQDASSLASIELDKRMEAQLATRADAKALADLVAKVDATGVSKEAIDALKEAIAKLDASMQKATAEQSASTVSLKEQHDAALAAVNALKTTVEQKVTAGEAAAAAQAKRADELAAQIAALTQRADAAAADAKKIADLTAALDANTKRAEALEAKVAALEKALAEKK